MCGGQYTALAMMSVGNLVDIKALGEVPKHITVQAYLDQIAVLQQADVFVSHCGRSECQIVWIEKRLTEKKGCCNIDA